jgi:hypothetical protein
MLGMVPKTVRVGDCVCVVAGACLPIIVRLIEDDQDPKKEEVGCNYVASGYFHGIMDGEIFRAADESGKEDQAFYLM